jgi:hypothetical protein
VTETQVSGGLGTTPSLRTIGGLDTLSEAQRSEGAAESSEE